MKKLSQWARRHKWQSRVIIVFSFILITGCGIITGSFLADLEVHLPFEMLASFVLLFVTGFAYYPVRKKLISKTGKSRFYFRQKTFDLLLAASTFFMIVCVANNPSQSFRYSYPAFNPVLGAVPVVPKDSATRSYIPLAVFKKSMLGENGKLLKWKERKKLLKTQIRAIKQDDLSNGAKIALIILSVIIAGGLVAGVMGLSCSLSCGGSEGLALIVLIVGVAGVGFLLAFVIKRILGAKKKVKDYP